MIPTNYTPFNEEWVKEVMKLSIDTIQKMFGLLKNKGESKKHFVERIALEKRKRFRYE